MVFLIGFGRCRARDKNSDSDEENLLLAVVELDSDELEVETVKSRMFLSFFSFINFSIMQEARRNLRGSSSSILAAAMLCFVLVVVSR